MSDPEDKPTEPTYEPIPVDELLAMGFDEFLAAVRKGMARADRISDASEDRTATTAFEEALRAEGVTSGYVLPAEPASHDDERLEALIRRVVREELDRK
jgi:hypothetical protein